MLRPISLEKLLAEALGLKVRARRLNLASLIRL